MTDAPKTYYAQAGLTEGELQVVLDAARALTLFPGEMAGLSRVLDQIGADHPQAAEDVAKVAQIIRIGAGFAQGCNGRIAETWSRKGSISTDAEGGVQ